ncbi:histidinol-phosphatase HisJ family protein [Bacillus sp. 1NLA3E]|uniref:histidinol-phosphatase HisJ family protein n=1 Tax=Bacillus sp. 1NLA3E TaxID=666686 RepID=UPI0002F63CC9|nr:histidinol-phosphatase HisJ family protein [Bacillus sp. 1NLA3E]
MDLIDYHHHTNNSFDSSANMEDICRLAVEKQIKEICFTEHFSVNPLVPTYGHLNFEKYFTEINDCQKKFADSLVIRAGIELCEPHLLMEKFAIALQPQNIDFILGSVHNVNSQKLRDVLKEHGTKSFQLYFEELYKMVAIADIDVIAHLDLINRYAFSKFGLYPFQELQTLIRQILEKAIDRNIGIEINTSGLHSGLKQTLPSLEILKLYHDLGGEILTIGSDSHFVDTVGANIREAYSLASECGFKYIFKFNKRLATPVELRL